jgi:hypothetical protein
MDDRQVDDFFDALAGRKPRADADPQAAGMAVRMRREVLATHGLDPSAKAGLGDPPPDATAQARVARVMARLEGQRAFADPNQPERLAQPQPSGWAQRISDWFRSGGLAGPRAGLALATFAGVAVVVSLLTSPPRDEAEVLRGAPEPTLSVQDPAAATQRLSAALQAAGAEVLVTQLSDTAWSLSVQVPSEEARWRIDAVLQAQGLATTGNARDVTIRLQQRR